MREGVNFGRLCANIPRKIPKENIRNNRVEVRWKVWDVAPLGGLLHHRAILVSVHSVWKNPFRSSSAITKEDCGGKAEYGRARFGTSYSVTVSSCLIFFPLILVRTRLTSETQSASTQRFLCRTNFPETNLIKFRQCIKTRFRYQVSDVQQRILDYDLEWLVKSDSAQVHIERCIQPLMGSQVRVVENVEFGDIWRNNFSKREYGTNASR